MSDTIDALRDRLAVREAELSKVRARLKAAKDAAARPPVKATISAIQKRYLSAVADLETKRSAEAAAAATGKHLAGGGDGGVSKLASRFNKGFDTTTLGGSNKLDVVVGDGHVTETRQAFANNTNLQQQQQQQQKKKKKKKSENNSMDEQPPTELLVEDDDGLPSWAKNQTKLMIKKENARSSIRDVDVSEIKDDMLEKASVDIHSITSNASYHDGMTTHNQINATTNGSNIHETVVLPPRGSVKKALAMWGKSIEEDMKILAMQKEEEERKKREQLRLARQRLEEERIRIRLAAAQKYATVTSLQQLKDLGEPDISSSSSVTKTKTTTTTTTTTMTTTRTSTTTSTTTTKNGEEEEDMDVKVEDVVMTKEEEMKIELGAFLERKIDLIDKEIVVTEEQAERVEDSINSF